MKVWHIKVYKFLNRLNNNPIKFIKIIKYQFLFFNFFFEFEEDELL